MPHRFEAYQVRRALKERAVAHLGGACKICGYSDCVAAMDFHHPDPYVKEFNISKGSSWKRIEKELSHTVLVCSRCHREIHDGLHPGYLEGEYNDWAYDF